LADFFLHGLQDSFVFCLGFEPVLGLILVRVERVDLSEGIEGAIDIQSFLFLRGEKAKELIVLGSKLEDFIDTNDHVVQVGVRVDLAFPLVLDTLSFPELSGQLGHSIFPAF